MAGIRDLMEAVNRDPYFDRTAIPSGKDPRMPSVKYDNKLLAEIIKNDPQFQGTNVGGNPAAYLDPRYQSGVTKHQLLKRNGVVRGTYYLPDDPRRQQGDRLWASTKSDDPHSFLDTLVHENIHGNTFEGPAKEAAAQKRGDNPPYLYNQLMFAAKDRLPPFGTNIGYEDPEPVAWVGAKEAMLPSGEMPIQEEMNRHGVGALYAHMTTAGPVATRWEPSIAEALKAYMTDPDEERIQMYGPSGIRRLQNYLGSSFNYEPYELRGNEVEKTRRSRRQ